MPIPHSKEQLIDAITDSYGKLKAELESLPGNLTTVKTLEGHSKNTLISVKDLIAYLIGWGQLVLKWNDKKEKGQEADFPETGYKWNELGLLAQKFYEDYKQDSYQTLVAKLDHTVHQILALVKTKNEDNLYGCPWYGTYTLGRMIQLNTSSPYKNARDRIRKWKKTCAIH